MESHSKTDTRKGTASKEKKAALAESEEEVEPLSPIHIGSEAPLPSEFEFPDALELRKIESDTQNRLKAILEVAGVTGLSQIDARTFQDPEILRKLTNSVSSALDEAATALTRMKSDRQTYEAFLRGANQAPSPSPLHPNAVPHVQHHPSSTGTGTPPVAVSGEKMSGSVTINSSRSHPPQQGQGQGAGMPLSSQSHQHHQQVVGNQETTGHGRSQPHHHHAHHHSQQQPVSAMSVTPPSQPTDSVQSVQRLLSHGHPIHEANEDGESLLSLACSAGYYELAEVLLRMKAQVEDRGIKGDSTPLMEAASGGYADIVKLLIDHGANVNAKSSAGNTALTYACCGGYEDVVKILLDAGADVEHQNENGHTPLMEAASCGHVGVAKLLLQYGANINTHSNEFKESALTLACYKGHLEMVKFLLDAGADQEHKTDEMHTALMEASMDGHVDVARLLLDHGAQVNMPVDSFESPLTLAACGGHYDLAALLISRGADLEEVNDEGYTPLMEAAREGHEDVVQLLVEHGANVNAQTEETQETALTLACCGGFMEVVYYLIEHGADIELGASTPLMEASQEGHVNIVNLLLEREAKVHAETSTGDTALTYACANGHTLIAEILLQHGAELEHESEGGRTPLMKAARAGHLPTIQFLVDRGADVNRSTTNNDHTVLSLASAGGHVSVVQYLLLKGAEPSHCLRDGSTMLIEAARGGHTSVVNLLLRQPLMKRRQLLEQASLSNESRKLIAAYGRKHATPSSVNATTAAAGSTPASNAGGTSIAGQQGKPLTSTLQHMTPEQTVPLSQAQQPNLDAASAAAANGAGKTSMTSSQQAPVTGSMGLAASGAGGGGGGNVAPGSVHLQHPGKMKPALKVVKQKSQPQQSQGQLSGREGGAQLVSEVTDKAMTSLSSGSAPLKASQGSSEGHDLIGAKRPKMSSADPSLPSATQSALMTTPTKQPLRVESDVPYMVTPTSPHPVSDVSSAFSPGRYTTDSATAIKNMQRLTSNTNSPLKSGLVSSSSELGSSVDAPPLLHSQANLVNSRGVTLSSAQVTPEDIIQGHMTADDIIARYWQQQNISTSETSRTSPGKTSSVSSKANGTTKDTTISESSAQRMFSAGNFSTLPSPGHAPRFGAASGSTAAVGMPPGDPQSLLVNSMPTSDRGSGGGGGGVPSSITQAPAVDSHPLSNMDLTRLIPHLEALAGSLQNPSSFESHYLAALAAQSQLIHHPLPVSSEDNTIEMPQEVADNKVSLPSSIGALDPSALLSAAEIAKLLPNIASLESQTDAADFVATPSSSSSLSTGQSSQPIYPTSLSTLRHLSQKLQGHVPSSEMRPDPGGGGEGTEEEEEHNDLDVDLLHQNPARSLPPSLLLDSKFPLDIPPPNDLIPPENLLPAGYDGSLENESYPTSDEEEEPDEDESVDSSYLAPDMSNLMPGFEPAIDIDQQTDSNHDTALTLAAAGGHDELVELLLNHGANIEHRDKKGCTPLILAASAGHAVTVAILLDHNADIEAQSDRTKDTALSLACSGGRQEVVELLLAKGANFEHRNVSDYTPLSLAASGGYVNIIKLLLRAGADINSRTGSKLGISPLMLAAMNGHTSTVKLLLDMGSDINAQIETNRNTALTLACFQGRHEVVNLLVERQANVEHRAKTGLTPLMEAASGGYYEVGKVLINKGADVNAAPVPSSKDTALTIAADKGHFKFVELILRYGAHVDVKNKKGNSPLWLASNGGHLDVIRLLVEHNADVDSQDNRKVSCLMAAFRRGHFKVVKYLVDHVSQFPSDSELTRYIGTLSDKELLKKSQRCMEVIIDAKERQAAEANKNATILLQEIDLEKKHEEDRRAAAARKREKKKRKKEKKKAQKEAEGDKGNGAGGGDTPPEYEPEGGGGEDPSPSVEEGEDDVIEVTDPVPKIPEPPDRHHETKSSNKKHDHHNVRRHDSNRSSSKACEVRDENHPPPNNRTSSLSGETGQTRNARDSEKGCDVPSSTSSTTATTSTTRPVKKSRSRAGSERSSGVNTSSSKQGSGSQLDSAVPSTSPRKGKREEGWKEVGRRTKKVSIPCAVFPQVIGKNNCILTAIRQATSTQIEIDRHSKQSPNRTITVRGSADAIKQVHQLISVLIHDPNQDINQLLPKYVGASSAAASSSSSTHKRHVSSSHDPTPSIPPLETFEVASDAQPAKGNSTATSASAAAAPTSSIGGSTARANYRKSGSVGSITTVGSSSGVPASAAGGKASANVTQSVGGSGVLSMRVGGQCSNTSLSGDTGKNLHQLSSVPTDLHDSLPVHLGAQVLTRVSAANPSNVKSSHVAATSGAVRRLFSSGSAQHQPSQQAQQQLTSAAPCSSTPAPSLIRTTSTSSSSGSGGVAIVRTGSGHSVAISKTSAQQHQQASGRVPSSSKMVARAPHDGSAIGSSGVTSKHHHQQQQQYQASSAHTTMSMGGASGEKQLQTQSQQSVPPSHIKSQVVGGVSMSYSRVINSASTTAAVPDSGSSTAQQQQGLAIGGAGAGGGGGEVIEQPLQQIMKTPTIFQDPATQLAKAKKKSTYSDAVGKKSGGGGGGSVGGGGSSSGAPPNVGGGGVAISGPSPALSGIPSVASSSGVAVGTGSGASGVSGPAGLQAPPSAQQIPSAQPHPSKIINLAPGSRPVGDKNTQLPPVGVGGIEKRSRVNPWNEVAAGSDKPHPHTAYEEDVESLPPPSSHLAHLGPIGPPSRSIKTGQAGFVAGPSSAGKQTAPAASGISTGRSFSPAGPRPKTSPTALNTSPHRNENSPAAKSPLLGTAPPGLLPPPDKGGGVYSAAFRPIQQHPEGDSSSNIPTLVPTPLRNSRPPLLETPPGFRYMSQGMRQKPSSPVPSPEKSSPNKSPPVQSIKGFNPNAPTFIPMAMQNQRPANPPTSSILGAPPTAKFPVFGPPVGGGGGASILGSAPQLPPGAPGPMYGGNQQPRMMSPGPPFSNQPPPPPPPQMNVVPTAFIQQQQQQQQHPVQQPPQPQPPLTQSSILGQPPTAPMNPPLFGGSGGPPPPAFQTIPSRPPAPPHPPGQGPPGGLIQQQGQGSSPFGINLVPFPPSGVEPIGTSGTQPHPLPPPNTGGVAGTGAGDMSKFGLPMFFKPLAPGSSGGAGGDGAGATDAAQQQSLMYAPGGGSAGGIPPHFEAVGGPGPPPPPPAGIITSRSAGPENLFNHLNLGQLGAMGGAEPVPEETSQSPSFQQASNGFHQYPYLHQQPSQELLPPSSSLSSVGSGGGVIFTPSSNFIVMTPGVFTTENAGFPSSIPQPSTHPAGGDGAESLLPIGTERAHKSSTLPAAFSMLAPGNVWSYSGDPSSEGSDWARVEVSDWPSSMAPSTSAENVDGSGHKLESVLERLGFSEYLALFQKNEIDLDALQLMSEKEFSEIGLPSSPTHKLLKALQQSSPILSSTEANHPTTTGKASSGSSTPAANEAAPTVIASSGKQHAASQ